jgi:hypothetical protein
MPAPIGIASRSSSLSSSVSSAAVPAAKARPMPGTKWWMWRPPTLTF